jgi:hypothetical protein
MLQIIDELSDYQVLKQGKTGGTCAILARAVSEQAEMLGNNVKMNCASRGRCGQQVAKKNTGLVKNKSGRNYNVRKANGNGALQRN